MMVNVLRRMRNRPRGQILIILAIGTLVLIAFTGFALDLAQYLIFRAQVRRAVDAAAMAAAAHFRGQYTNMNEMRSAMRAAAEEVLALNGFNVANMKIVTSMDGLCDDPATDIRTVPDMYLCFPRQRKKVWVEAQVTYETAFIRLFGLKTVTVTASAVGEAASLDVVLVIDISASLAYGRGADPTKPDHEFDDPAKCNVDPANPCLPFEYIRRAAKQFARQILDLPCNNPSNPDDCLEQDRLAIVVFSTGWEPAPRGTYIVMNGSSPWFKRYRDVEPYLNNLKVYDPGVTLKDWLDAGQPAWAGVVRTYTDSNGVPCDPAQGGDCQYRGNSCTLTLILGDGNDDVSTCTSTNIGGALREAGRVLYTDWRDDALRVVILLSTGVPNATFATWVQPDTGDPLNPPRGVKPKDDYPLPPQPPGTLSSENLKELPFGYCPSSTQWSVINPGTSIPAYAQCRDLDVARYVNGRWVPSRRTNIRNDPLFDAEDYAYYYGDKLGCPSDPAEAASRGCPFPGLEAVIFTVGIGDEVVSLAASEPGDPPAGAFFLRYLAALGDDNDPTTDPCRNEPYVPTGNRQKCGNYFWLRQGSDVREVLDEIARRIFTRLSH